MAGKVSTKSGGARKQSRKAPVIVTDAQAVQLREYVDVLAGILRLRDWTIVVDTSRWAGSGSLAEMQSFPNQKRATLRIGEEFKSLPADEQRQTLVHEMLHCHLFELHDMAERMANGLAGSSKAARVGMEMLDAPIESAVDALADVLAPLVPEFHLVPDAPKVT